MDFLTSLLTVAGLSAGPAPPFDCPPFMVPYEVTWQAGQDGTLPEKAVAAAPDGSYRSVGLAFRDPYHAFAKRAPHVSRDRPDHLILSQDLPDFQSRTQMTLSFDAPVSRARISVSGWHVRTRHAHPHGDTLSLEGINQDNGRIGDPMILNARGIEPVGRGRVILNTSDAGTGLVRSRGNTTPLHGDPSFTALFPDPVTDITVTFASIPAGPSAQSISGRPGPQAASLDSLSFCAPRATAHEK